jgi:hypothetical protein
MLIGLLGETGGTIPDFYKTLGAKLKISAKAAEKLAEQGGGKIDPQLIMNMITESVNKSQGGIAGTGGNEYAKTFEARVAKIKNLPEEYFRKLADSPAFQHTADLLGGLLEKLDPDSPAGRRIQSAIEAMFDKIDALVGNPEDAAGALANSIENAVELTRQLLDVAAELPGAWGQTLETIEDMVLQLRFGLAVAKGDDAAQSSVAHDMNLAHQRRIDTATEKNIHAATPELGAAILGTEVTRGNLLQAQSGGGSQFLDPLAFGKTLGRATRRLDFAQNQMRHDAGATIRVAPGAIVVHATPGVSKEAAQKMGQDMHKEMVSAVTRGAAEGG